MNSYSLIIADIHLHPDDAHPINHAFYHFLTHEAPKADALYILGDLFEMWVGDDIGLEQYQTVITLFSKTTQAGLPIYLLFGNRDFLMRKDFWQATGIQPIFEPYAINLYGHELLMLHGDVLCTDDHSYQRARKLLRNPLVMWLFLKLSRKKRLEIGNGMREKSKRFNQNKAENIMDVNDMAVKHLLTRYPAVTDLIHGHTHRPAQHSITLNGKAKTRWVLSDWRPESNAIQINKQGITFRDYTDGILK